MKQQRTEVTLKRSDGSALAIPSITSTTLRAYCAMTRSGEARVIDHELGYLKALSGAGWQARPTEISRQVAEAIGSRDIASYEVLRNSQYRRMRTGISRLRMFLRFYTDGEFTEHEETLPVIHQQFLVSEWGCPLPNACLLVNTTKRHAFTHTLLITLLVGRHGDMKCNLQNDLTVNRYKTWVNQNLDKKKAYVYISPKSSESVIDESV